MIITIDFNNKQINFESNDLTNVDKLKSLIKESLSIPKKKQLLFLEGNELENNFDLSNLNKDYINIKLIKKGKTQNKCSFDNCNEKISIIGECKWCQLKFCNQHRIPECHKCINFSDCKEASFNKNAQLLTFKCNSNKIDNI